EHDVNITLQRVSMNSNDVYKRFITNKLSQCSELSILDCSQSRLGKVSVMLLMSFIVQYHVSERNCFWSTKQQHA
ncbi:8651_t:CDS:1, partial [Funneliformis caledonium]